MFVHGSFIDLGNSLEIVAHYLLINGMTCLSHQDEFPIMSVLKYIVTY